MFCDASPHNSLDPCSSTYRQRNQIAVLRVLTRVTMRGSSRVLEDRTHDIWLS